MNYRLPPNEILDNDRIYKIIRDTLSLTWDQKTIAWLILTYRDPGKLFVEKKQALLCSIANCNRFQLSRRLSALKKHEIIVSVPVTENGDEMKYHNRYYFVPDLTKTKEIVIRDCQNPDDRKELLDDLRCAVYKLDNPKGAHRKRTRKALLEAALKVVKF